MSGRGAAAKAAAAPPTPKGATTAPPTPSHIPSTPSLPMPVTPSPSTPTAENFRNAVLWVRSLYWLWGDYNANLLRVSTICDAINL